MLHNSSLHKSFSDRFETLLIFMFIYHLEETDIFTARASADF